MKLRYYLRGLGIGIVVTALIMGIAFKDNRPLTDAEIRAAAHELGMVESDSLKLSDIQSVKETPEPTATSEATETPEPTATSEATETPEPTATPEATEMPESTPSATVSPDTEQTEKPEITAPPEAAATPIPEADRTPIPEETPVGEKVTITIVSGSGSGTVSRQLAEAGLVEDAGEYDRYLMENGYDRRISVGTYEIGRGADWEQIAKIITRTK